MSNPFQEDSSLDTDQLQVLLQELLDNNPTHSQLVSAIDSMIRRLRTDGDNPNLFDTLRLEV